MHKLDTTKYKSFCYNEHWMQQNAIKRHTTVELQIARMFPNIQTGSVHQSIVEQV